MLLSIFSFAWIFSLIYFVYTYKLAVKRFSPLGYLVTGLLFSGLCGSLLYATLQQLSTHLVAALLAFSAMIGCATIEVLYCLQLSQRLFGQYHRALRMVKLYHKGLLLPIPYHQGEELYWIDRQGPLPCVRKMYFVAVVSDCYIGIYQDHRQLVIVKQVFADRQMAYQCLDGSYLYTNGEE